MIVVSYWLIAITLCIVSLRTHNAYSVPHQAECDGGAADISAVTKCAVIPAPLPVRRTGERGVQLTAELPVAYAHEDRLAMLPRLTFAKATSEEKAYILKYAETAVKEAHKFKIPAAIKLAQGIIESDRERSYIANKAYNHFGVKWHSKLGNNQGLAIGSLVTGTGSYRVYKSPWFSYRDHSYFLQRPLYRPIYTRCGKNYKCWAYQLKAKGYAEDKDYASKLIWLIDRLELYRYDGLTKQTTTNYIPYAD